MELLPRYVWGDLHILLTEKLSSLCSGKTYYAETAPVWH